MIIEEPLLGPRPLASITARQAFLQRLHDLLVDQPAQFVMLVKFSRGESHYQDGLDYKLLAQYGLAYESDTRYYHPAALSATIERHVHGDNEGMFIK
jgi:hypothetical protein